jgi:ABC-type phosphate transport system substrate-binding protein
MLSRRFASLIVAAPFFAVFVSSPAAAQSYTIIVNSSSTVTKLSKAEVAGIFLKKSSSFPDGSAATPVDQHSPAVREAFSKAILDRDVASIKTQWQQRIFAGRGTPPAEKASDAEVIGFVESTPGAIGYVSASAPANPKVKAVSVAP